MCNCQVCQDIARWRYGLLNGDDVLKLDIFREMFGRIEDAETTVDYFRAIHQGNWPSGKTILEHALKKYDDTES
jgi:hypothetical protein